MKSLFNLNNKLLNKGYFSSINKKIIFSVYMMIKNDFKKKLCRKCKVSLLEQIMITLFKLRYNLPDRIMEDLFRIDHVIISRIIIRINLYLSKLKVNNLGKENNLYLSKIKINIKDKEEEIYYCVDSTVLRIGKGKNKETYSGYKHYHGVKFQVVINNESYIKHVSKGYSSSIHDKKLFLCEYKELMKRIDKNLNIIGDKGYSGLKELKVEIPIKRNEIKYKENKSLVKSENKNLSVKRIKIEHVFSFIKSYRIMQRLNYYSKDKIEILFNSIANIYNLSQLIKI